MHDPRVGRFFAVDPLTSKYPHYTPYQFSGNKVIHKVELEGLEEGTPEALKGSVSAFEGDYGDFDSVGESSSYSTDPETQLIQETYLAWMGAKKSYTAGLNKRLDEYEYTIENIDDPCYVANKLEVIGDDLVNGRTLMNQDYFAYKVEKMSEAVPQMTLNDWSFAVGYGTPDFVVMQTVTGGLSAAPNVIRSAYMSLANIRIPKVRLPKFSLFTTTRASDPLAEMLGASSALPDGEFYSVAYQMELSSTSYPGVTRYMHFKEANISLNNAITADSGLAQSMKNLGIQIPKSPNTGTIIGKSPSNWVWHHNIEKGVMELVPKPQHPNIPGGIFWETMHPNGIGGFSIWGK